MKDAFSRLVGMNRMYYEMFLRGRGGESWTRDGHFQSQDGDIRKLEQFFNLQVPVHEEAIAREIYDLKLAPTAAPLLLLLVWTTRLQTASVILRTAIFSEHHEIHAAAIHALMPIIATKPTFPRVVTVQDLVQQLVRDQDPQCMYRTLRLLRSIPLSRNEFDELAKVKTIFQELRSTSMHIGVQHWAEQVTLRIVQEYPV